MFDKISPIQLVIVLLIVVMIFGVGRLPKAAGSLGKAMKEFRKGSSAADDDEVEEVVPKKKHVTTPRKARATKASVKKEADV